MAETRVLGDLPTGGAGEGPTGRGHWGYAGPVKSNVATPRRATIGKSHQDSSRVPAGTIPLRQPDNDIVISPDLLMELTFIPPTAIDLQFHPDYPKALHSISGPVKAQRPAQQTQRQQAYTVISRSGDLSLSSSSINFNPGGVTGTGHMSSPGRPTTPGRRPTPCLTGRPAHRSYPGLSASVDTFHGYQQHLNHHTPDPPGPSLLSSRTSLYDEQGIGGATPRMGREGRKPLQRFAPMLSVPPPQSTAFIEARRRHLRMLMENSSGRPPPNTPELHQASRASTSMVILQDLNGNHQGASAASPVSARSASRNSARGGGGIANSRPPTRTGSVAVRLSQRAPHNNQKSPDVKPIVLRMRTRADDNRANNMTQQSNKNASTNSNNNNKNIGKDSSGIPPMTHIAPKMLVHQWLEMGNKDSENGQSIGYGKHLEQHESKQHTPRHLHMERIAVKAQHRCLRDVAAKR